MLVNNAALQVGNIDGFNFKVLEAENQHVEQIVVKAKKAEVFLINGIEIKKVD